jgi:hypothetical protein
MIGAKLRDMRIPVIFILTEAQIERGLLIPRVFGNKSVF